MAAITATSHRAVIDPLKLSRPLGAALVFLGVAGSIPLLHGSQGCAAFAKALLTKHFREPIPLQTTAVTELTAVLGSTSNLVAALDTLRGRLTPEVIGVVTTGVSEVSGEDVQGALRSYRSGLGPGDPLVVLVSAPDFVGGLSDGWSDALVALVEAGLGEAGLGEAGLGEAADPVGDLVDDPLTFPVLAGVSLTAADLEEIALTVEGFGFVPRLVPDLSGSLDGHLAAAWTPLTTGGVTRRDLARLGTARYAHALGVTTAAAARTLTEGARTLTEGAGTLTEGAGTLTEGAGTEVAVFPHLSGLDAVDAFVERLWRLSGRPVPARVRRDRARLADGLLDTHVVLGGARVAIAAEPELLAGAAHLVASIGARVVVAVSPTTDPVLRDVPCDEVVVGDLTDLRERAAEAGVEVVIGSSHAVATATAIGAAHVPLGIPVDHRYGAALGGVAGYRGGLRFITDLANVLLTHRVQPTRKDQP